MDYPIFDAHCDTLSEMLKRSCPLRKNDLHIDFERMSKYPKYVQVFAAFVDKKSIKTSPKAHVEKLIETYKKATEDNGISRCKTAADAENAKYGAILAIEGGEAIEGSLENLEKFYASGVRMMTLTWNYRNEIADGITEKDGKGLTPFGKKTVRKMNAMGMVADVSHLSEKGFWDVVALSAKPFVASHSNARKLCASPRNLTDEQIKAVICSNGVIGLNFYPTFVNDSKKCNLSDILDHAEHILSLGGEDNLGIGSDFDGIDSLPKGMTGIESMESLISLMENRGFGKALIKKLAYENFMRVFKANLS